MQDVSAMNCECEHRFCIHETDVERMSLVNIGESQCGLGAVVYSSSIVMLLHNINIY